jgi:hypothetical protein
MHNDVTRLDAREECCKFLVVIAWENFDSRHFELFKFPGR